MLDWGRNMTTDLDIRSNWLRPPHRQFVEDCLTIDANHWMREGILKLGDRRGGSRGWLRQGRGAYRIVFESLTEQAMLAEVQFAISWIWAGSSATQNAKHSIGLVTTRPQFGGVRWWFVCPLRPFGKPCNRRAAKLYLPEGSLDFGCRECHGLKYKTQRPRRRYRRRPL